MYSANYGGYGNAGPNFNNGAPQPGGQQQQMMYNQQPQQPQQQQQQQQPQQQQQQQQQPQQQQGQPQQQFGGMGPQGGYPQGANPQMMASMMQNPGMQQMAGNGQMAGFQQQFPGNPYGQMPSSAMQQNFPQGQYMMPGGMQGFQMNQGGMPQQAQQQMMQRMQAQQQAQAQAQAQAHAQAQAQAQAQANAGMTPAQTPQRPPSSAQGTPGPVPSQQGQFPTPQPPSQVPTPGHQQQQKPPPQQQPQQQQAPQQQPQSAGTATPQTPTFGANQGIPNGASSAVPLSPGTAAMESQRFSLLLDINSELLYESIQIQTSQQEIKKQRAKEASTGEKSQTDPAAQKAEDTMLQQDYLGCMNRLKANLTYMAALADRKPDVKVPQSPAYLTSPNLNLTLKLRTPAESPDADPADRESRAQAIKELYSRLQAAFPGVDPKKEPPQRPQGPGGQKPGNPVPGQQQPNSMQPTSTGAQQSSTHVP